MNKTRAKKKTRDRKERLILETVRYGIAAVLFGGVTAALWFADRTAGIVLLVITCAFAAAAAVNFIVGSLVCRSFIKLSEDAAVTCAFINEYGHLELCGGERKDVRKYAEFAVKAYGKMYRPVGTKPSGEGNKAAKAEQKRISAEEKALTARFSPYRQFDNFTPADLRALQNKTIFVSERMHRFAAEESDWQKAKENNEIVIISGPVLGQKTER